MKAQHDSRLGRDGEGVPPSIYMETAGNASQPIWIIEACQEDQPLTGFETAERPLFYLENGPDGGRVTVRAMICAKDCALVPARRPTDIDEETLSVAQQQVLKRLEVKKIVGGNQYYRVANQKSLTLRAYDLKGCDE